MIKKKRVMSITLILIIINFVFFMIILALISFNPNLINYVGIMPSKILNGEDLWTVITNMFMHASPSHLFMNMLSLLFLGSFLERVLGRKRFLIFYLSAGIFASLFFVFAALIFKGDMNALAVGASGAVFGIAGLLAVLTPKLPVYILFIPIAMPMWFASILILLLMWLISLLAGLPIGNTAHLGGLISGLVYGIYLRRRYKRKVYLLNKFLMARRS